MLPAQTLVWPEESKEEEPAGPGLWGSDEDFWGATEKMWAKNEIEKVSVRRPRVPEEEYFGVMLRLRWRESRERERNVFGPVPAMG